MNAGNIYIYPRNEVKSPYAVDPASRIPRVADDADAADVADAA